MRTFILFEVAFIAGVLGIGMLGAMVYGLACLWEELR
jgi:hypothetical protein